jgi:hypothetical protein
MGHPGSDPKGEALMRCKKGPELLVGTGILGIPDYRSFG